jgi:hypothetical protein
VQGQRAHAPPQGRLAGAGAQGSSLAVVMAMCAARGGGLRTPITNTHTHTFGAKRLARCWLDTVLLTAVLHYPAVAEGGDTGTAQSLYSLSRSVAAFRARVSLAKETVPQPDLLDLAATHHIRHTFAQTRHDIAVLSAVLGGAAEGKRGLGAKAKAKGGAKHGVGRKGLCAAVWVDADGVGHACPRRASFAHCLGGGGGGSGGGIEAVRGASSLEATVERPVVGLYCKSHRPAAFRNVAIRKCMAPEGCARAASFGPPAATLPHACLRHAKPGFVNLLRRKCQAPKEVCLRSRELDVVLCTYRVQIV